jgi:hypothetical protein
MPIAFILVPLIGLLVTLVTAHWIAAGIFVEQKRPKEAK